MKKYGNIKKHEKNNRKIQQRDAVELMYEVYRLKLNMDEEAFHRIELKAAYTQYIMLSYIAKNLAELKER